MDIQHKLLDKSKEAFVMAIELYNKPTISYRVEGFSFFICNAWELMLKAHMINTLGEDSIYYKDSPDRTITLENCVKKIFTNKKAPLRINLEKIIYLRNTSTHYITQEYEMVYIPLFQSCVFNFVEKMVCFHDFHMDNIISQNFLTLSVNMNSFNASEIRARYPKQLADRLISTEAEISCLSNTNNADFSINIDHHHFITKDKNKATTMVGIANNSEASVTIIKELKDPNKTHKYTVKKLSKKINEMLSKNGISLPPKPNETTGQPFNQYHFRLFCYYYNLKKDQRFCFTNTIGSSPTYSYSQQTIDFIFDEIKKDPQNIIENLKKFKAKKISQPQGQRNSKQ